MNLPTTTPLERRQRSRLFALSLLTATASALVGVAHGQVYVPEDVRRLLWDVTDPGQITRALLTDLDGDGLQDAVCVDGSTLAVALGVGFHRSFQPAATSASVVDVTGGPGESVLTVGDTLRSWTYDPTLGVDPFVSSLIEPVSGSVWENALRVISSDLGNGVYALAGVDASGEGVLIRVGTAPGLPTEQRPIDSPILDIAAYVTAAGETRIAVIAEDGLYSVGLGSTIQITPFPLACTEAYIAVVDQPGLGIDRIAALARFEGRPGQELHLYDELTFFEAPVQFVGDSIRELVSADVDLDGDDDLVAAHDFQNPDKIAPILIENRYGEAGATQTFWYDSLSIIDLGQAANGRSNNDSPVGIMIGDVTNDGDADLVVPSTTGGELLVAFDQSIDHRTLRFALSPDLEGSGSLVFEPLDGSIEGTLNLVNAFAGTTDVELRAWYAEVAEYDSFGALLPLVMDAQTEAETGWFPVPGTQPVAAGEVIEELFVGLDDLLLPIGVEAVFFEITPLILDTDGTELERGPLQSFAVALDDELYGHFVSLYGAPSMSAVEVTIVGPFLTDGRTEIGGITPVDEPPDFLDECPPQPGEGDPPDTQ